jgi:hypothetical protein
MSLWKFEITDNGHVVAEGDAPDEVSALREAAHYAQMYGQDGGDVKGIVWTGRKPNGLRDGALK